MIAVKVCSNSGGYWEMLTVRVCFNAACGNITGQDSDKSVKVCSILES